MSLSNSRLEPLFAKTRTVCFGRFLVDIPATAILVYGPAEVDAPIQYFAGHGGRVAEHLAGRMAEVERERDFLDNDDVSALPHFGKVIDGEMPGQKIVFGSKNQVGYTIHSFIPVENDLFVQHLNSVLPHYDRLTIFNKVAAAIRPRLEGEIPTLPGTCIEGAFVPLDQKYERVTLGVRLLEFADVHFSIEVHKNQMHLPESGRLELMRQQAEGEAEQRGFGSFFSRIKVLRQGLRQQGEWTGFEIATRTPALGANQEAHEFRFQSLGSVDDPLRPFLDVRLDSGVKYDIRASVKPSVTDEEAMELWDRLIRSIRIRPVSEPSGSSTSMERPDAPATVATGDSCPRAGYWRCREVGKIVGQKRQSFAVGACMPPVLVLKAPNVWQRMVGHRPSVERGTVWEFVGDIDHVNQDPASYGNSSTSDGTRDPHTG